MRAKGPKVTLQDAGKILRILYPSLAEKSRQSVPHLRSTLLNNIKKSKFPSNLKPLDSSYFTNGKLDDSLTPKQSVKEAVSMLPKQSVKEHSNVLYFRIRNQLLHKTDFLKLITPEQTTFKWDEIKVIGSHFTSIQARDPETLLPRGGYYLLFKNAELASAYLVDTLGRQINGVNLYLEMISPQEHSKFISQQLLHETPTVDSNNFLTIESARPRRYHVLVRGFPTFVKKETIKQMLWDYKLDYSADPVRSLKTDEIAKIGMWLLTFESELESLRFIREYNGKNFNNEARLSKVYASVLT